MAKLIPERVKAISEHMCQAFGAKCHLEYRNTYPATVNDPEMCRRVWASAEKVVGVGQVVAVGEDRQALAVRAVHGVESLFGIEGEALDRRDRHIG